MQRFKKRLEIGRRWLACGGRLFSRNPWLLGGMGFSAAVIIGLLALIPLAGTLLVALFAPVALASAYLQVDAVSRQKMALPAALRLAAIRRAPKELLSVLRDESHVMQMIVLSIYSMTVVLFINLAVRLAAGGAWVDRWTNLELVPLLGVLALALLVLLLYFALAISLVYAIPLMLLQEEALFVAAGRSLKAGARHVIGLVLILGLLLVPLLLGHIASYLSNWAGYLVWIIIGTIVLPLVATSLYCSYRTLFAVQDSGSQP